MYAAYDQYNHKMMIPGTQAISNKKAWAFLSAKRGNRPKHVLYAKGYRVKKFDASPITLEKWETFPEDTRWDIWQLWNGSGGCFHPNDTAEINKQMRERENALYNNMKPPT